MARYVAQNKHDLLDGMEKQTEKYVEKILFSMDLYGQSYRYMYVYIYIYIWVSYNELTTSSLEIIVSKGNHPQMALIQVSELL